MDIYLLDSYNSWSAKIDTDFRTQLASQLEGFKWFAAGCSQMVEDIAKHCKQYYKEYYRGSVTFPAEDPQQCGFCGKKGILNVYYFDLKGAAIPVLHTAYMVGKIEYVVELHFPQRLATGSECCDFPWSAKFVRDNYNGLVRVLKYSENGIDPAQIVPHPNLVHKYANHEIREDAYLWVPSWLLDVTDYGVITDSLAKYSDLRYIKRKQLAKDSKYVSSCTSYSKVVSRIRPWGKSRKYVIEMSMHTVAEEIAIYMSGDTDIVFAVPVKDFIARGRLV